MKNFDVIAVGNANIDAFLTIHEADTHCHINEKECEICFPYGQKVLVDSSEFLLGGGASNIAVGLSRLGFKSSLVAEIGSDEFEQKIVDTLSKEGVDQTYVIQTKGAGSSFSVGITFKGERTLFIRHVQRAHKFQFDQIETKWVYLGGLGKEWKEAYQKTLEFVKNRNVQFAFAPGTTQLEEGYEAIKDVLEQTDILFLNKEEAEKISNFQFSISNEKEGIKKLLQKTQELGVKTIVITDGENGSFVMGHDGKAYSYSMESYKIQVVQKTGAGDAYASGFLGALLSNLSIKEAMRWGSFNAASVIGKVGAQAGLLTQEEIKKHPDLEIKNLLQ